MMVEDRAGRGSQALQGAVYAMMGRAAQTPGLLQVFSLFENSTPQLYLDIDRTKAQLLGINVPDVFARAADLSRLVLRQRLQPVRPHLPRDRAGQERRPRRYRGRAEDPRAQQQRRDGAARLLHHGAHDHRALSRAALQSLSGGRARRRGGARLQPGPGDRDHGEARGARRCRRASLTNGPRSPSSRSAPATPRSSPSCWRWCSCSWCSPRNSKA